MLEAFIDIIYVFNTLIANNGLQNIIPKLYWTETISAC